MRYGITLFGNKETTAALARAMIRDGFTPDLVVTLGNAARQKVDISGSSDDLAGWCRAHGIAVYECASYALSSETDRAFFDGHDFGIGVCTGWQRLIPPTVLARFEHGIFGFHGSHLPLPKGRGRSPLNWTLRQGGDVVFHNCFRYSEGADEGGIYNTTPITIAPHEAIKALQFKALVDIMATTRRLLTDYRTGSIALREQPKGETSWFGKLTPDDSRLALATMDMATILGIVRASSRPFSGAFAVADSGVRVTFWAAHAYEGPSDAFWETLEVGAVLLHALGVMLVKCHGGLLMVTECATDAKDLTGMRFA